MNPTNKEDIVMSKKDIAENMINQITLECLINKEQYNKFVTNNNKYASTNKKDKKFYRKRILQLTRDILTNNAPEKITNDVLFAFENYVKICIPYFQMIDQSDIIQSEYENLLDDLQIDDDTSNTNNTNEIKTIHADKLMLRQFKNDKYTLDKFVKVTNTQKDEVIIPTQKDINLKEPSLRNKGVPDKSIRKKKNIDNKYEEESKNEQK
jgi:hypothetical protein